MFQYLQTMFKKIILLRKKQIVLKEQWFILMHYILRKPIVMWAGETLKIDTTKLPVKSLETNIASGFNSLSGDID